MADIKVRIGQSDAIKVIASRQGVTGESASSAYANQSGISSSSNYAVSAGIATNATYAENAGIATNVIGGIGSVTQLNVSGFSTISNTTAGIITAARFFGDGSGLTGVTASGTGVNVRDNGSVIGVAATIDFGQNLAVSPVSSGFVTVTATPVDQFTNLEVTGITTLANVKISSGVITTTSGIVTYYGDVAQIDGGSY